MDAFWIILTVVASVAGSVFGVLCAMALINFIEYRRR